MDKSMNMQKIARQFQNDNLGKGEVNNVTDYSFQFTTLPDKNGKSQTTVYMESYFLSF